MLYTVNLKYMHVEFAQIPGDYQKYLTVIGILPSSVIGMFKNK